MRSMFAALLVVTSASVAAADVPAAFIDGTYVETAESCQRLKARASGTPAIGAAPGTLTRLGYRSADTVCRFKSIARSGRALRWNVTMACVDDEIPMEIKATFTRRSRDAIAIFVREHSIYWPASTGFGQPVPGRTDVRVVTEKVKETAVWQRCRL